MVMVEMMAMYGVILHQILNGVDKDLVAMTANEL